LPNGIHAATIEYGSHGDIVLVAFSLVRSWGSFEHQPLAQRHCCLTHYRHRAKRNTLCRLSYQASASIAATQIVWLATLIQPVANDILLLHQIFEGRVHVPRS